ncbi:MAG: AmmeMemoRadiSam system protein B, partial [Spirochaetales bacterium]|nr:AmmeMemoRadiSam system protein B [Spirochaetales bacterium]
MGLNLRPAAVAGTFYPEHQDQLERLVGNLLASAVRQELPQAPLRAVLVPHAGYIYSGPVAASAFSLLRRGEFSAVSLWGPSHHFSFSGVAENPHLLWQIPGKVFSCTPRRPAKNADLRLDLDRIHEAEHSLEVELPFLAQKLPDALLDPVLFGEILPALALDRLVSGLDTHTLIVVSSDLSHYYPQARARKLDTQLLEAVLQGDVEGILEGEACGKFPLAALVLWAKSNGWKAWLLDYRTSADTAGSPESVVGYAAVAWLDGT